MSAGLDLMASILENGSSTTFRLLSRDEMVDDNELLVYDSILSHYRRYRELPTIGTVEELTAIRFADTPEHVDFYLDQLHDRYVYNEVREEFAELRESLQDMNIEGMLRTSNEIRRICTPRSGQSVELMTLAQVMEDVRNNYDQAHRSLGVTGIPTGHRYLDEQTGGYQDGDLVFWVARPSQGKTHLLVHGARTSFIHNKSVLFVSMEMPLDGIGMRFAAHHSGINPDLIRKGRLSYFARQRLDNALVTLGEAHNFHLYAGNFNKTTADVDILIQELGPDIVYIDGVYLMKPSDVRGNMGRFERAAYVVDDVKRMTLTHDRPIVGSTQFGKGAGKHGHKGDMETIGYTDTIGTHSSIVCAIKPGREIIREVYDTDDNGDSFVSATEKAYPFRIVEILKGREGEHGEWGMNFSFAPLNFDQVPIEIANGQRPEIEPERPNLDYME